MAAGVGKEMLLNEAMPVVALVTTVLEPRNVSPSRARGSAVVLKKNSITNDVLGRLLSEPETVVFFRSIVARVRSGKFCKLFGPVSVSSGSLTVTPGVGPARSIPREALAKMELDRMALPVPAVDA